MREPVRFPSKIDVLVVVVLSATLGVLVAVVALGIRSGDFPAWISILGALPIAAALWIFASTYYLVSDTELLVRSGPVNRRIPLTEISNVTPTRNPLSSPALSLDRLEIAYGNSSVLISPKDKDGFLRALTERGVLAGPDVAADADAADPSSESTGVSRLVPVLIVPVVLMMGYFFYTDAQAPAVEIAYGQIHIKTATQQDIPMTDVIGLTLENTMPRVVRKYKGLDLLGIQHGRFVLEGVGNARLYLQAKRQPPFVKLETRSGVIYINYATPADTGALYERMTREINK
ncbi:MAG: PH domain-containing protein [Vicinamibacterales bacterium]|nr:PH domain-containing protein [Vicinamibacterales bacterium]